MSGQAPTAQMYAGGASKSKREDGNSRLRDLASAAVGEQDQSYNSQKIDETVLDPRLHGYERAGSSSGTYNNTLPDTIMQLFKLQSSAREGLEVDAAEVANEDHTKTKPKKEKKKRDKKARQSKKPSTQADTATPAEGHDHAPQNVQNGEAATEEIPVQKSKKPRESTKRKRKREQDAEAAAAAAKMAQIDEDTPMGEDAIPTDPATQTEEAAGASASEVTEKTTKKRKRTKNDIVAGPNGEPPPDKDLPRAGPLVRYEIDRVEKFIEQYRRKNDLQDSDINTMVQNKSRERDPVLEAFWGGVYEQLPYRDPRSIRLSTRRRHHNYVNRGRWADEDDAMLRNLYAERPNGWTYIGEAMARMPDDCKDRWQNYLQCGEARKIGEWTEKEEIELARAVESCKRKVRNDAREQAHKQGRAFRDDLDWTLLISFKVVSEMLGRQRSGLQCRQHWKVMGRRDAENERKMELGDDDPTRAAKKQKLWRQKQAEENFTHMLPGDKYALLEQIQQSETRSEDKIPWRMLTADIPDTKWSTMDRKIAWDSIKTLIDQRDTLQEHVAALKQYFEDTYDEDGIAQMYDGAVKGSNEKVKRELRKAQMHEERERRRAAEEAGEIDPSKQGIHSRNAVERAKALVAMGATNRSAKKYKSSEKVTDSDNEEDGVDEAKSTEEDEDGVEAEADAEAGDESFHDATEDHDEHGGDDDAPPEMNHPYQHAPTADMGQHDRADATAEAAAAVAAAGLNAGSDVGYEREDSMPVERGS